MKPSSPNRLIVITGPSCVGKTPLEKALRTRYPELSNPIKRIILYTSRKRRPGELDAREYHFRTSEQLSALADDSTWELIRVRGSIQAIDLTGIKKTLTASDALYEGNTFIAKKIITADILQNISKLSIFISPFSLTEIRQLAAKLTASKLKEYVFQHMRLKLVRRAQKQKTTLDQKELANIELRAGNAYQELGLAHHFNYVIPNHDGEDSDNWNDFNNPMGEALRTVDAVADLLKGTRPEIAENWISDLLK